MLQPTQTTWVILAGGQATRMGGDDKGFIELNHKPLIQHVIERLKPQTDRIFINANRNQSRYQAFAPVFADHIEGFQGPLGGMHAALNHIETDWVGFVPCDSPNISFDLVERFCRSVDESSDIWVAHDGHHPQPVFALCHKRVLPALTTFLQRGERKMGLFFSQNRSRYVDFSDSPQCFVNLNTPQELAQFGKICS